VSQVERESRGIVEGEVLTANIELPEVGVWGAVLAAEQFSIL